MKNKQKQLLLTLRFWHLSFLTNLEHNMREKTKIKWVSAIKQKHVDQE